MVTVNLTLLFDLLQPLDQKVEISAQIDLSTENIESSVEEVEEPLGPTMKGIFMEIKQMTEKGAKCVLTEVICPNCFNIITMAVIILNLD